MSSSVTHLKGPLQGLFIFILCLSLFVLRQGAVQAASYTVTSASDAQTTCGTAPNGTLRWSVCSAVAAGDVITIDPGLTITLGAALPQLTNTNLTIQGNGSVVDGAGTFRGFDIAAGANISIDHLTIQHGFDGVQGGGIKNAGTLTVTNCTVAANSTDASGFAGGNGGGIYNTGTLTVTNCTVVANSANNNAGGGGDGGGIYNAAGGIVILTKSMLSSNSANNGGGIGGNGGGIINFGTVTVANSTLVGNHTNKGGGGTINFGMMTITNTTLAGNSALVPGQGGSLFSISGTLNLNNTIVASSPSGGNCSGTITSNGAAYNLSDDNTCGASVTQVTAAQLNLGSLSNNGGQTQTIPLLAGSVAIGQGQSAFCILAQPNGAGGLDQRGVVRKSPCDIGAYEIILPPIPTVNNFATPPPVPLCSLIGGGVDTMVRASVPNNTITDGSVFCRVLNKNGVPATDSNEIGNLSVLQRGVLQAVDVFGLRLNGTPVVPFNAPIQVCLQGGGTLLFLDASQSPRTVSSPAASSQGGYTCASISNAGTVVLVNGPSAPTTSSSSTDVTALTACPVTTTHIVNLRAEPGTDAAVLTQVPYNLMLGANARQGDWYQVAYGSNQGWISAQFLTVDPTCR